MPLDTALGPGCWQGGAALTAGYGSFPALIALITLLLWGAGAAGGAETETKRVARVTPRRASVTCLPLALRYASQQGVCDDAHAVRRVRVGACGACARCRETAGEMRPSSSRATECGLALTHAPLERPLHCDDRALRPPCHAHGVQETKGEPTAKLEVGVPSHVKSSQVK